MSVICSKCGASFAPEMGLCPYCGTPMPQETSRGAWSGSGAASQTQTPLTFDDSRFQGTVPLRGLSPFPPADNRQDVRQQPAVPATGEGSKKKIGLIVLLAAALLVVGGIILIVALSGGPVSLKGEYVADLTDTVGADQLDEYLEEFPDWYAEKLDKDALVKDYAALYKCVCLEFDDGEIEVSYDEEALSNALEDLIEDMIGDLDINDYAKIRGISVSEAKKQLASDGYTWARLKNELREVLLSNLSDPIGEEMDALCEADLTYILEDDKLTVKDDSNKLVLTLKKSGSGARITKCKVVKSQDSTGELLKRLFAEGAVLKKK